MRPFYILQYLNYFNYRVVTVAELVDYYEVQESAIYHSISSVEGNGFARRVDAEGMGYQILPDGIRHLKSLGPVKRVPIIYPI